MSHEKLSAAIRVTIDNIDEEFVSAEALLKLAAVKELDFIETAAAASILQSFYTGIENLVLFLCKSLDDAIPKTQSWHRDLLDYASKATEKRPAIFDASTRNMLVTYLDYRLWYDTDTHGSYGQTGPANFFLPLPLSGKLHGKT